MGEQTVERHVEAGELGGAGAPGAGQRARQRGLLVEQLTGAVPHAAGVDEEDLGVGADQVEQDVLALGQPGEPRLHAVELQPLGQLLPLLPSPRLGANQLVGPGPHLVGGEQLAAAEDLDAGHVAGRALGVDRELGEAVHLVAPQVDAHRHVGGGREHVDDRSPHRHLAPVLDLVLAAVAGGDERGQQVVRVDTGARRHDDRFGLLHMGAEALHERPGRGNQHARHADRVLQAPHRPQPPAHRLDARADPLERQRLPCREDVHRVGAQEGAHVVGQPLAVSRRRHGRHDRVATRHVGEAGDGEGPGRLGHGQDRAAGAGQAGQRLVLAQQRRQILQGHRTMVLAGLAGPGWPPRRLLSGAGRVAWWGWRSMTSCLTESNSPSRGAMPAVRKAAVTRTRGPGTLTRRSATRTSITCAGWAGSRTPEAASEAPRSAAAANHEATADRRRRFGSRIAVMVRTRVAGAPRGCGASHRPLTRPRPGGTLSR